MKRKGGFLVGRPFDVRRVCKNCSQDADQGTLDGLGHIGCSDLADFFEAAVSSRATVGQARSLLCARVFCVLQKKLAGMTKFVLRQIWAELAISFLNKVFLSR